MVGVRRLSDHEIEAREEKRRQYRNEYNAIPENKKRKSEYYQKYNQVPMNKESHRISQARYRNTVKGKDCDVRAWKKYASKSRNNAKNDTMAYRFNRTI